MTIWVNPDTGETVEGDCPFCATTTELAELQVVGLELEARRYRSKIRRLEDEIAGDTLANRSSEYWKPLLNAWLLAFPHKRPTATGIKSQRAKATFQRLDSGATVEDFLDAIAGCMAYPYVVYGSRRQTGSDADLRDDIADIACINNDAQFDQLRDVGHALRNPTVQE